MRIGRRAAAKEAERLPGGDLVPGRRGDQNGVTGTDGSGFAVDLHGAVAFQDEVKLLAEFVVVAFGGAAGGDGGFGEALVFDGCVGPVEDAADLGAILGGEGFLTG